MKITLTAVGLGKTFLKNRVAISDRVLETERKRLKELLARKGDDYSPEELKALAETLKDKKDDKLATMGKDDLGGVHTRVYHAAVKRVTNFNKLMREIGKKHDGAKTTATASTVTAKTSPKAKTAAKTTTAKVSPKAKSTAKTSIKKKATAVSAKTSVAKAASPKKKSTSTKAKASPAPADALLPQSDEVEARVEDAATVAMVAGPAGSEYGL